MSSRFEVVSDTFDAESDPTYSTLEVLSIEDLLIIATKHQDEEVVKELARRGLDFKKASDDAAEYANRMMFGPRTEEKDE